MWFSTAEGGREECGPDELLEKGRRLAAVGGGCSLLLPKELKL